MNKWENNKIYYVPPKNQRIGKRIAREIHLDTRNRKLPKRTEIPLESIEMLTFKQNKMNQSPRQPAEENWPVRLKR